MGKRLITQARGKGGPTNRPPSHKNIGEIKNRKYDDIEKNSSINGRVIDLLHCPGHNAPLAKVKYDNGEESLVSAPLGIRLYDIVSSGAKAELKIGNTLPLKNIPEGTDVYNIESQPGDGGKFARTSGGFATVVSQLGE